MEAASLILPRISLNWMEKHGESLALEPSAGRWLQIAEAFGCHILCYSASGSKYNTTYEQVGLDELLSRSDIVSVHAPLNAYTENLMTLENFRKMKKTAHFSEPGKRCNRQ